MSETVLEGKIRQTGKKGPSRRIRAKGFLPGIIYGQGENLPVTVESMAIKKILEVKGGVNNIITIRLDGDSKERTVMIKFLDVHPIYDTLLHIDLIEVDIKKPIKISVAIEFTGVSKGVKLSGGRMNVALRSLNIECLPTDIPTAVKTPIDDLDVGDSLRVKDLHVDSEVTILNNPETVIVNIVEPKVEAEPEAGEAEAAESEEAATDEEAKESTETKGKKSTDHESK
ncbi:LSU ribosomal protein L25p [hydrothermal vent metagenome]|uniref:LSU ribosomal protein L25p n=1 Tax=hydrothermal vent metagenome TaxID=652676 RepID=A0A3B1C5B5_9ZZZZ